MRVHNLDLEITFMLHGCCFFFLFFFSPSVNLPGGMEQIILECRGPGSLPMSITIGAHFCLHCCHAQWCNLFPPRTPSCPCYLGVSIAPVTFLKAV